MNSLTWQIGRKSAEQHGCHESRSSKLNFSDPSAYYTTVLHKYNSPAVFCEKTPKKALSTTLPLRFVGMLFTFTSSSRTCSPAKKSLVICTTKELFSAFSK